MNVIAVIYLILLGTILFSLGLTDLGFWLMLIGGFLLVFSLLSLGIVSEVVLNSNFVTEEELKSIENEEKKVSYTVSSLARDKDFQEMKGIVFIP